MALKGRLDVIQKWDTDGELNLFSLKDNGNKRSVQRKRPVNTLPILQTDKVEDWAETWILCKGLDPNRRDRPVLLRLPKAQWLAREPVGVQLPVSVWRYGARAIHQKQYNFFREIFCHVYKTIVKFSIISVINVTPS